MRPIASSTFPRILFAADLSNSACRLRCSAPDRKHSSTEYRAAVCGSNCISPCACLRDTALGLKFDSRCDHPRDQLFIHAHSFPPRRESIPRMVRHAGFGSRQRLETCPQAPPRPVRRSAFRRFHPGMVSRTRSPSVLIAGDVQPQAGAQHGIIRACRRRNISAPVQPEPK